MAFCHKDRKSFPKAALFPKPKGSNWSKADGNEAVVQGCGLGIQDTG
jgi:hypothetical protein